MQPPEWLTDVTRKHRPLARFNDLICSCSGGGPYITWTPEHLARHIYAQMTKEAEANEQPIALFTP